MKTVNLGQFVYIAFRTKKAYNRNALRTKRLLVRIALRLAEDSYLALDDIEIGVGNKIPFCLSPAFESRITGMQPKTKKEAK